MSRRYRTWLFACGGYALWLGVAFAHASGPRVRLAAPIALRTAPGPAPAECLPLPDDMPCEPPPPNLIVPCVASCEPSDDLGERCVVDVWQEYDSRWPSPLGADAWWVLRSRVDGRRHYIFGSGWGVVGPDRTTYVLCDNLCWYGIEAFWLVLHLGPVSGLPVKARLVTNDCASCRLPTPTPNRQYAAGPFRCGFWAFCPIGLAEH